MNCIVCKKPFDNLTPLCTDHAPAWGKCLRVNSVAIFAGELGVFDAFVTKIILRQNIVRWWLGSDVWLLWALPPGRGKFSVLKHRLKYHLTKFLVSENWMDSERLFREFVALGGRRAITRYHIHGMLIEKVEKKDHSFVNVAYYAPKDGGKFQRYVYGLDLIEQLELRFPYPDVNWIPLNGKFKMRGIYSILDAYIRPSRHDGGSRIIRECRLNDIPFYWSEDGHPDLDEMDKFVDKIIQEKSNR